MLKLHYFLVTIKSYLTIHFSSPQSSTSSTA